MPTLKSFSSTGTPRLYSVHKPVTTIGKALGNDLPISGAGVRDHHAQIVFDGRDFVIEECDREGDIAINGKKKRRARLVHGDRVQLGASEVGFSMFADATSAARRANDDDDAGAAGRQEPSGSSELAGVRKLFAFSEKLSNRRGVDELLEAMLDDVIEVTHADKGFLLLIEGAEAAADAAGPSVQSSGGERKLAVRASRNVRKEAITDAAGGISDSIVQQVLDKGRPVIVSDALADTQFGRSESVIAMKLSSVMCVPLMAQGQLIGALYVGNDKIKHLFDRAQLDLLSIFASQSSLILQNAILVNALRADKEKLTAELKDKRFGEIIGACPSMLEVFRKLQKVAATDISVLITGETGTGKELIAREVHRRSNRAGGPFITINCGAIPENLIESELFGHVKGAFTGAIASRPGKFQLADKGTLFLDEIGELPLNLQVKLLRALQERVVFRVGDSKPEKVDIRVVAATNRTLEDEIKANNFREDLYYRLNVVNLWMPPLRDRGDDVLIIAKALLSKYADELQSPVRGYSPAALAAIKKYTWPGNIRQLENRIKKALVLCDRPLLGPEDLDLGPDAETPIQPLEKAKEEFQRRYVLEVLERNNGNRTQTARDLGVDPRTIFRYLEREQNPIPSGAGGVARDPSEG
ncbi:sigma 54-interacting transcriptional regulator [Chondromyces apiculatus]|uniref:Sigma-54 dependent transcriptional regulator n=1 Tax=Chondromyces apiculatus DSM 436 TaxID=1192034 RepID=A0A017TAN7_9BACT|nr:sigma 54-interacting transcriptional regulator [Chondromyces apiculatus]EYF05890.1 sigma-54 dependent transcriptional regulator [Chondromyces apiculatus DSM 436]